MEVAMRRDVTLREEYVTKVWEDYIHDNLVESTPCKAAIYDFKSGRLIIASNGFYLFDNEINKLTDKFGHVSIVNKDTLTIQSCDYDVRLADGKNGIYATNGEDGCTVCKTQTLLIVGVNSENVKSDECNEQIMKLGDYFRTLGL